MTPERYCSTGEAKDLLGYFQMVDQLKYTEKPFYQKLKFELIKSLLGKGEVPTIDIEGQMVEPVLLGPEEADEIGEDVDE